MSRILHVAESFSGGVADFVLHLAANLPHHSHTIVYGIRDRSFVKESLLDRFPKEVRFIEWTHARRKIHPVRDLQALQHLVKILADGRYDIVHLHSSKAGFLGRLAGLFHRQSGILYTTHCIAFLRKDVSSLHHTLFILLEWIAGKLPGLVLACSKSEAEVIRAHGIRCSYIQNAIPAPNPRSYQSETTKKLSIVTVGRITAQKGPELFNQLAERFLSKGIDFLWIGDGDDRALLTSPNILITGWLPKEKVFEALAQSNIYVSTAFWEGLPLSVLEAMHMGLPLVLQRCVGNIDCVQHGVNGYVFDHVEEAEERCTYLSGNPTVASEMGNRSLELIQQQFDFQHFLEAYDKHYKAASN